VAGRLPRAVSHSRRQLRCRRRISHDRKHTHRLTLFNPFSPSRYIFFLLQAYKKARRRSRSSSADLLRVIAHHHRSSSVANSRIASLNLCRYCPVRRTASTGTHFGGGTPYRQFLSQWRYAAHLLQGSKCHKNTKRLYGPDAFLKLQMHQHSFSTEAQPRTPTGKLKTPPGPLVGGREGCPSYLPPL